MSAPALAPDAADDDLIRDAALCSGGALTVAELQARHGPDVLDRLLDAELSQRVEARAVAMGQSGALARGQAHAMLRRALVSLDAVIGSDEVSPGTLLKVADLAHKISGMAPPERPATGPEKPIFSVNIMFNSPRGDAHIVDAIDVTPEDDEP